MECPRTQANEELGCAGRKRTGPQLFVTTLWHVGLGLPWAYRLGPGTASERSHLQDMLPDLPPRSLLLADGGFIGYDLCQRLMAAEQAFVLRVSKNTTLLTQLGCYEREDAADRVPAGRWLQETTPVPSAGAAVDRVRQRQGQESTWSLTSWTRSNCPSKRRVSLSVALRAWRSFIVPVSTDAATAENVGAIVRRINMANCTGTMLGGLVDITACAGVAAILERGGESVELVTVAWRRLVRQALATVLAAATCCVNSPVLFR